MGGAKWRPNGCKWRPCGTKCEPNGTKWGPKGKTLIVHSVLKSNKEDQVGTKSKNVDFSLVVKRKMDVQWSTRFDQEGTKWDQVGGQVGTKWGQVGTK